MFKFLLKVWGLARPYRGRLFLGVLTGIVAGVMEPLMIATVAFVYGLIFPSAEPNSSLLRAEHFRDAPALITRLNNQAEPFSQFLWSQFSAENRHLLTKAVAASNRPPAVPGAGFEPPDSRRFPLRCSTSCRGELGPGDPAVACGKPAGRKADSPEPAAAGGCLSPGNLPGCLVTRWPTN